MREERKTWRLLEGPKRGVGSVGGGDGTEKVPGWVVA